MSRPKTPAWQRVLKKVVYKENGCWIFTGHTLDGYGHLHDDGKNEYVHRIAFREAHGWLPAGHDVHIDHTCHNNDPTCPGLACEHRACVNPAHLEAVTAGENNKRAPRWNPAHCPHGHAYTPENTAWSSNGKRRCRACDRERHRRMYRARTNP